MDTKQSGRTAVLLVLVSLVVGLLPVPNATAATVTPGAIFNNPTGSRDQQYAIHQHEVDLVQKVAYAELSARAGMPCKGSPSCRDATTTRTAATSSSTRSTC